MAEKKSTTPVTEEDMENFIRRFLRTPEAARAAAFDEDWLDYSAENFGMATERQQELMADAAHFLRERQLDLGYRVVSYERTSIRGRRYEQQVWFGPRNTFVTRTEAFGAVLGKMPWDPR